MKGKARRIQSALLVSSLLDCCHLRNYMGSPYLRCQDIKERFVLLEL